MAVTMSQTDRDDPAHVNPAKASESDPQYCWFELAKHDRDEIIIFDSDHADMGQWIQADQYRQPEP